MLYGKQRPLIDGTEDSPDATAEKVVQLTCGDHCRWSYVMTVAVPYGESMDHSSAVDMLLTCRNRGRWGKTQLYHHAAAAAAQDLTDARRRNTQRSGQCVAHLSIILLVAAEDVDGTSLSVY